jgi:hypothetical protein
LQKGSLREKNFDIRKTAGGKSFTAVSKSYTATVSKNFLEIHLFWAGKGTCCIPIQGYYGPMISALSVTPSKHYPSLINQHKEELHRIGFSQISNPETLALPDFTPTVRNGVPEKKSNIGAISGIVIGVSVLVLAALFGIFMFRKRRRLARQQQGIGYTY